MPSMLVVHVELRIYIDGNFYALCGYSILLYTSRIYNLRGLIIPLFFQSMSMSCENRYEL